MFTIFYKDHKQCTVLINTIRQWSVSDSTTGRLGIDYSLSPTCESRINYGTCRGGFCYLGNTYNIFCFPLSKLLFFWKMKKNIIKQSKSTTSFLLQKICVREKGAYLRGGTKKRISVSGNYYQKLKSSF